MERKKRSSTVKIRRRLVEMLRFAGLSVRPDSMSYVLEHYKEISPDIDKFVALLVQSVDKTELKGSILESDYMERIMTTLKNEGTAAAHEDNAEVSAAGISSVEHEIQVINAGDVPRVEYDETRKRFRNPKTWSNKEQEAGQKDKKEVLGEDFHKNSKHKDKEGYYDVGDVRNRITMYKKRYHLVAGRNLRHKAFRKRAISQLGSDRGDGVGQFEISPIRTLMGGASQGVRYIFGMLSSTASGMQIEDDTGAIRIRLDELRKQDTGFFAETCFVLAEGEQRQGNFFFVFTLVMPILEPRNDTLRHLEGKTEFFCRRPPPRVMEALAEREQTRFVAGQSIVLLADILLDKEETFKYLNSLLSGWRRRPPRLLIFIGSFFSDEFRQKAPSYQVYVQFFEEFASSLRRFSLAVAHEPGGSDMKFIFVPSPSDPLTPPILPHAPLNRELTTSLRKALGDKAVFPTNPCRIRFFTKEIVVFREDLLYRFIRNALMPTEDADDDSEQGGVNLPWQHLIKTLISQAHLCPLPQTVLPVSWSLDEALFLHPLPHFLILADKCNGFLMRYFGLACLNPGSFSEDGSFVTLRPLRDDRDITFNKAKLI